MTVTGYPTAPPLPGISFRHVQMPDDLAAMNDVANDARVANGEEWVTSYAQFQAFFEHLSNCDPETDVVVAERDGRLVGYGRAAWYEDLEGGRVYEPVRYAHPDEGSQLDAAILEAMEARCREIAAGHPRGAKVFQTESIGSSTERNRSLRAHGYQPVRYSFMMVRPHLDDLPGAPMPDGLEIRQVEPDQLRSIFDAEVEAFRDHWGMGLPTDADYQRFLSDPVQSDHSLWRVAWDGDQVAGMVRSYINEEENRRFERKRGWVENISVRRPWRKRGLARALIAASFPILRARGMTEGALGVDTENPTGALHLYESCGFTAVRRETTFRKPLE